MELDRDQRLEELGLAHPHEAQGLVLLRAASVRAHRHVVRDPAPNRARDHAMLVRALHLEVQVVAGKKTAATNAPPM